MTDSLIKYINCIDTIYGDKLVEVFSLSLESLYRSVKMNQIYEAFKSDNDKNCLEQTRTLLDLESINHNVVKKNLL